MHAYDISRHAVQGESLPDGLNLLRRGKVKDVFDLGDVLLMISTDRMSAGEVIIAGGFCGKGQLVNQLSAFWFRRLRAVFPNHLVSATPKCFPEFIKNQPEVVEGRAMLVWKALPLPVRCVVRGYLAGSAWHEYQETGAVCGHKLPAGMVQSQRLPTPMFAPALSGGYGGVDENMDFASLQRLLGDSLADQLRQASLRLYLSAWKIARDRGVLIADTTFEFGLHEGKLMLINECLTPDTSRFWALENYRLGGALPSLGKQMLVEFLEVLRFTQAVPDVPDEILGRVGEKYREAYRRIVGKRLELA